MSKMMNDLNRLNETRKVQGGVVVEEEQEAQEKVQVIHEHKGIYVLSVLVVLLIVLSAVSLSTGIKIFEQLDKTGSASNTILQTLKVQGKEIQDLKALVMEKSMDGQAQNAALNGKLEDLNIAVREGKKEMTQTAVAYNSLKNTVEASVEELKVSDNLMLKKFIQLNDKVEKLEARNSLFYGVN